MSFFGGGGRSPVLTLFSEQFQNICSTLEGPTESNNDVLPYHTFSQNIHFKSLLMGRKCQKEQQFEYFNCIPPTYLTFHDKTFYDAMFSVVVLKHFIHPDLRELTLVCLPPFCTCGGIIQDLMLDMLIWSCISLTWQNVQWLQKI